MNGREIFIPDVPGLGIACITAGYIHKEANKGYCSALSMQPDEIIGHSMADIWGEEQFNTIIRPDLDHCLSGKQFLREASLNFPVLGHCSCQIIFQPYHEEDGRITAAIMMIDDLTALEINVEGFHSVEPTFNELTEEPRNAIILIEGGVVKDVSDAFRQLFGHVTEKLKGRCVTDFISPGHCIIREEKIQPKTEGTYEATGLRANGTRFPIEVNFRQTCIEGQVIEVCALKDLTKFKKTEQLLKAYQQRLEQREDERTGSAKKKDENYSSIYANVLEGMFRTDANGRLISANAALARMYGFEQPEDLIDKAWNLNKVYAKPKDRKLLNKLLQNEGEAHNLETELYTRDGSVRWARMNVKVEKDEKGNILFYEGTLEDITEKKWAEDKYRNIFLNATEGIFQLTPEGRCFNANPALARIHGFDSPQELIEYAPDIPKQLHVDEEAWREYLKNIEKNGYVRDHLWKMYRKDGSIAWLSVNARIISDENGHVLYHEGTIQDVTEKKLAVEQILMQRDLALRLAQTGDVGEGLALTLETAIKASGMECGGIWLKRLAGEDFELISSIGFPPRLERKINHLAVGSPPWKRIMTGKSILAVPSSESMPNAHKQGYKYAVMIPILHDGQIIGSFNLFSRLKETISEQALIGLEFLAGQLGSIVVRIRVQQQLEDEIITRKETEQALQAERLGLEEANITLKVLLGQREKDREELEQRLISNVSQLVIPYVEKLKKSRLEGLHRTTLGFIETNLKEILSPFRQNIQNFNLTPRQVEIVGLIKQGRSTKEIAEFLNTSKDAIDKQRFIIRKKLGVNKKKTNLRTLLLSF